VVGGLGLQQLSHFSGPYTWACIIEGEVKHDVVSQIHLIWTLHVGLLLKGGGGVVSMCHSFLIGWLDYFLVWRLVLTPEP